MNKREFVERIANKLGMSNTNAKDILDGILAEAKAVIREEGSLRLSGFGAFTLQHRPARKARNPRTGEQVDVPAKDVIKFKEYAG